MATSCKYEFKAKHFSFHDCEPERFYRTQWSENRWIFWVIKLLMFAYWAGWFAASLATANNSIVNWWIFLTNWGVCTVLLYFIVSFAVATYGIYKATDNRPKYKARISEVSTVSCEVQGDGTNVERGLGHPPLRSELRWFHIMTWILHIVAINGAIIITVAYWALLTPIFSSISINNHLINAVIMVLDLFLNDIPVRLLHFYHVSLFAIVYTVFSAILHGAGYTSAVYPVLDWANSPGLAAGLCAGVILVAAPIAHAIVFGFYHLRWFIARKTVLAEDAMVTATTSPRALEAADNPAFADEGL